MENTLTPQRTAPQFSPPTFRPANYPITKTRDQRQNGFLVQAELLKARAKKDLDTQQEEEREREQELLRTDLDKTKGFEWGGGELDDEKDPNVPIKSEIAKLRRILGNGGKLTPSEASRLGKSDIPEAKDLLKINRARTEEKGFTLSPMKLLMRSLKD